MPVDEDNDGTPDAGAGMAAIWADDFIASDIWDCNEPIKYSIFRASDIDSGAVTPTDDVKGLTVTCDDESVVLVYIYAFDAVGNFDKCEAMLLINDFMELCNPIANPVTGSIAGLVTTEQNGPDL